MKIKGRWLAQAVEMIDGSITKIVEMLCVVIVIFVGYVLVDKNVVERGVDVAVAKIKADGVNDFSKYDGMVGWLRIEGTHIDYPVMQGRDNEWYLRHDFENNYAAAGSVFVDYRNALEDDYLVIYGHRMTGGAMFSDIGNYADEAYLEKYRLGQLLLGDEEYEMQVLAYAEIFATDRRFYGIGSLTNEEILREMRYEIINGALPDNAERLALLSTCDAMRNDRRDVLLVSLNKK